jgi:hypothetical protein
MSKKDYQAIARTLFEIGATARAEYDAGHDTSHNAERLAGRLDAVESMRGALADILAADNPRFDRARFIEACETGTTRGMRKVSA